MDEWLSVATPAVTWKQLVANPRPVWVAEKSLWLVHVPAQVERVACDPRTFSSAVPGERRLDCDPLLTVDPPQHTRDRYEFVHRFGPRIRRARRRALESARQLVSELPSSVELDLVSAFCRPLGAIVGDEVVGTIRPDAFNVAPSSVYRELERLASLRERPDRDTPIEEMRDALCAGGVTPERAAGRAAGLACALLVACEETLPAGIALTLARVAGGDTTRAPRPLMADTPLLGLYRVARRAATVGGVRMRRGEQVFLAWAAANARGGTFDYTYGFGPHRCPAAGLVDAVVGGAVSELVTRAAVTLLDPVEYHAHSHFRAPVALRCRMERHS